MDPFAPDWTESVLRPLALRAHAGEPGTRLSDELLAHLWPWALRTADQMARRLPPGADQDALRGEVLLEVFQATRRIEWPRYPTWPAFLRSRLRNAWSTTARAEDPLTRSQRAARRTLLAAQEESTHALGREPTTAESAKLSPSSSASVLFGLSVVATAPGTLPEGATPDDADPATQCQRSATRQAVHSWIDHDLPPHLAAEMRTLLLRDEGDHLSHGLRRRLRPYLKGLHQRLGESHPPSEGASR